MQSNLFQNDFRLEACLSNDFAQILPDHQGDFVRKLHRALQELDSAPIGAYELANGIYGPTTARAVQAFKQRRGIAAKTGSLRVTNTVCRATLAAMDRELMSREGC
jgi:peptidoglycan hydrolase-like protein with peptidoglycan-binding domain